MRATLLLLMAIIIVPAHASLWCVNASGGLTPSEAVEQRVYPYGEVQIDLMSGSQIQVDIINNYRETRDIYKADFLGNDEMQIINGVSTGYYQDISNEERNFRIWTNEKGRILMKVSTSTIIYHCE